MSLCLSIYTNADDMLPFSSLASHPWINARKFSCCLSPFSSLLIDVSCAPWPFVNVSKFFYWLMFILWGIVNFLHSFLHWYTIIHYSELTPWHNDQIVHQLVLYSFPNMCSKPFRWQESLFRFKHIFGLNDQRTKQQIPIYYLPGNHDIGYSAFHSVHPEVINHSCFPPLQAFHLLLSVISCYYLFWKVFYFSSHAPLDKDRLPWH